MIALVALLAATVTTASCSFLGRPADGSGWTTGSLTVVDAAGFVSAPPGDAMPLTMPASFEGTSGIHASYGPVDGWAAELHGVPVPADRFQGAFPLYVALTGPDGTVLGTVGEECTWRSDHSGDRLRSGVLICSNMKPDAGVVVGEPVDAVFSYVVHR